MLNLGFPGGANGKEPTCQSRIHKRHKVQSLGLVESLKEGRELKSTQYSPGKSGQRILWGCKVRHDRPCMPILSVLILVSFKNTLMSVPRKKS